MDKNSDNTTKNWLKIIKFFKIFKNESNHQLGATRISTTPRETAQSITFRRNIPSCSLTEIEELRKNDNKSLRRTLRKWHRRMKNCFSKNSRITTEQRRSIHTINEAHSVDFSRNIVADRESIQKENTYSVDPCFQRNLTISVNSVRDSTSSLTSPQRSSKLSEVFDDNSTSESKSSLLIINDQSESSCTPKSEISTLVHQVWYWGPISKYLVEAKLDGAPEGTFLVRDSASERHIFTISFRTIGKTLHTRIEHSSSGYRVFDHEYHETVKSLIDEAVRISQKEGVFCYTKSHGIDPNYPVRLLKPLSRYDEVRSLQSLSRFVIRQHINVNDLDKLSLPVLLIRYLKEDNYFE